MSERRTTDQRWQTTACAAYHAAAQISEERFRALILRVREWGMDVPLLIGECPHCGTTLSYQTAACAWLEEGVA